MVGGHDSNFSSTNKHSYIRMSSASLEISAATSDAFPPPHADATRKVARHGLDDGEVIYCSHSNAIQMFVESSI